MTAPPVWLLWLCVAWAALTFLVSVLVFVGLAWTTRRAPKLDLSTIASRAADDAREGDRLLDGADDDERDHIERSHG